MKVPQGSSKVNEWKPLGFLVSTFQDLYATMRDTFGGMGIGFDIIPWLAGDGKKSLVEKLKQLGTEFTNTQRVRTTSNKNVVDVNLDAPLKMPFDGGEAVENVGGGWVKVELKKSSLYVNGKKVVPYLDEGQKDGKVMQGHKLAEALKGKAVLHPNILDALKEYPHLVPDELKKDGQGRAIYLFFWAVKFRNRDGRLFVRCGYWNDGGYRSYCYWLEYDWLDYSPAAVCAS